MNRLFTFGCSFTQYYWPTWSDVLGREFEHYENWAKCAGGNTFITNSVSEAIARRNINENDTVIVMWTSVMREDRYTDSWMLTGNIFTQGYYSEDFVKKYVTEKGCYIRDLANIYLTYRALKSTGCKFHFLTMVDVANPYQFENANVSSQYQQLFDAYAPALISIKPSVHSTLFNYDWFSRPAITGLDGRRRDPHPLPNEHLEFLDKILPDMHLSTDTRKWANDMTTQVEDMFNRDMKRETLPILQQMRTKLVGWSEYQNWPTDRF